MGFCKQCIIILFILQSAIVLIGLGIFFIVAGVNLKNNSLLVSFDAGDYAYYGGLGLGIGMLVLVMIAIALMICKNKCCSTLYGFFIFIAFAIFVALCTISVLAKDYIPT